MLKEEPLSKRRARSIEDHPQRLGMLGSDGRWWDYSRHPSMWTPQAPPHPQKPPGQKSSGTMRERKQRHLLPTTRKTLESLDILCLLGPLSLLPTLSPKRTRPRRDKGRRSHPWASSHRHWEGWHGAGKEAGGAHTHCRPVRMQGCSTRKRDGILPTLEALKWTTLRSVPA